MLCCALICHSTLHIDQSRCEYLDEWRLRQCCCRHALMMKPVQRPLAGTSRMHRPEPSLIHFLSCVLGKLTTGLQAVSIVLCWQRTIHIADECHRCSDLGWDRSKMPCINWNTSTKCIPCTISAQDINAIVIDLPQLQLILVNFWSLDACSIA